jgi:glycosyltransferase involved in cell wall biosynthesis
MRIVHITPDYHPTKGGGELYVKEVSERLAARGHQVTVLALNSRGAAGRNGEDLPSNQVIEGVTVRRLNNSYRVHQRLLRIRGLQRTVGLALGADRSNMLSISPWSLQAFLLTLRARADVVGVFNWYHGFLAYQTAIARALADFALVGFPLFHTERPWAMSPLFPRILARCDVVAVMTEHEKRFVESRSGQATARVVGAGVEPSLFTTAAGPDLRVRYGLGHAPVVGYLGRMSASKGVVTLIDAMKIVWRRDPSVRLLLAGSGLPSTPKCDDEIRDTFARLSESERSRLVAIDSFTDDQKPALFGVLDVFAMTSVAESFGIAYLEAWMCGKAVIGSTIGATACVIRDGIDGMLVTPGSPDELARSIELLLGDRAAREQMGKAGHDKALTLFTWDKVVDRIESAYEDARARREAGARSRPAVA